MPVSLRPLVRSALWKRLLGPEETQASRAWNPRDWTLPLVALLGIAGFFLATLREGQEAGDAAVFLNHTVNIAEGRPYTNSFFVPNPEAPGIGGLQAYPPGLPVVFALVYAVAGFSLPAFKVTIVLFFLGSLFLLSILASRMLSPVWTAGVILTVGFNPYFWQTKEALVSHIPFLFWCLLAIVLVDASYRGEANTRRFWLLGAAGLAMVMAILTRSVGVALPAALLLYEWAQRRKVIPGPSFWIPVGIVVFGVAAQHVLLPVESTGNYMSVASVQVKGLGDLLLSVVTNAKNYAVGCVTNTLLDNAVWAPGRYALAMLVFVFGVLGFGRAALHRSSLAEPFLAVFTGIILVWPFQMLSYMVPGYVLLFYYAFLGARRILGTGPWPVVVAVLLFGLTYLGRYGTLDFERLPQDVASDAGLELHDFVKSRTSEEALFVSRTAADFALYTNRRTMPPLVPGDYRDAYTPDEEDKLFDFFERKGVQYVVTGPRGPYFHREILPLWSLVEAHPDRFTPVHRNDEFGLYRVRR